MQMDFTYDDFRENYLHSSALIPVAPLNPLSIVDEVKLSRVIDKDKINARVRMTFNELEKRMGGDYFAEFENINGQMAFLNAAQNYFALKGQQTNLFRCFLPQAWTFCGLTGVSAFLHPDSRDAYRPH